MKNKRQYRDSAMFTMIGYIGIILVVLAMLVGIGEYTGFNEKVQKGLQDDPRPLTPLVNYTHPNTWSVEDSTRIIDSLRCNDSIFDALLNCMVLYGFFILFFFISINESRDFSDIAFRALAVFLIVFSLGRGIIKLILGC